MICLLRLDASSFVDCPVLNRNPFPVSVSLRKENIWQDVPDEEGEIVETKFKEACNET